MEEAPKVTVKDDATIFEHPAFGQISATRVTCGGSGHVLYGSDFGHNSYIRVTISGSELERSLSRDFAFGGIEYRVISYGGD